MPSPQAVDRGIWDHMGELLAIIGPFISLIGVLIIAAWKNMEKSVDKMEKALTEHVAENDKIHDRLFTDARETEKKLEHLLGEHERMKDGN